MMREDPSGVATIREKNKYFKFFLGSAKLLRVKYFRIATKCIRNFWPHYLSLLYKIVKSQDLLNSHCALHMIFINELFEMFSQLQIKYLPGYDESRLKKARRVYVC